MTTTILDELRDYVGFTDEDAAHLRALHPVLAPHFGVITKRFYDAILAHPEAAAVLNGPAQVERLKATLIDWMSTGLLGPHDERFYEKRSRIGRRHVAIGLAQHYMFTAMSIVRTCYLDLVDKLCAPEVRRPIARAVDKLLDIELAIMVRHYQLDYDDKLLARERRIQGDRLISMQTLSAGLAHEVRNPLNAAKLQLELLERRLRKAGDDPRLVEPTEVAQKEIERLTALLNDFLAFARPPELHRQPHDVAEIVRHVVELEKLSAERRPAELALVASPAQLVTGVDAPKLHQVVLNLVRNAIEAVPPGGHISVELVPADDHFSIRVQDDGPGIPPEVRARIYEPFFSTKEGGTGLGMSIVHSLVALHGGSIEIDTGASGTRFDVSLPRA